MSDFSSVTVEDLIASLKARRVRIPSEIGAFVALETCEALMRGPAVVRGTDVRIGADGTVSVSAPPHSARAEDAARSVTQLLASLLVAAGTGVPSGLVALVENGPISGPAALERLRDDLEASLVPLNRAAARRVLSRMVREARRAPTPTEAFFAAIPEDQLDAAVDELLRTRPPERATRGPAIAGPDPARLEPHVPRPTRDALRQEEGEPLSRSTVEGHQSQPAPSPDSSSLPDAPARSFGPDPRIEGAHDLPTGSPDHGFHGERHAHRASPTSEPERKPEVEHEREPAAPAIRGRPLVDTLDVEARRVRTSWLVGVLAILVVGLGAVAGIAVFRPDLIDRALGRSTTFGPRDAVVGESERQAGESTRGRRLGTLVVRSTPDRAQVLLFVGRGPANASRLPTGIAYEFVAIAEGRAPTRAVVPADARWESTPDGLRYELAMQTGDPTPQGSNLVLGETRLPWEALGAPSGRLGTVRIVTTPPGAKVYLLVGFTPDVRVQNVPTDEAVELLVYRSGYRPERIVIGPSDWTIAQDGTKGAEVSVTLEPIPAPGVR